MEVLEVSMKYERTCFMDCASRTIVIPMSIMSSKNCWCETKMSCSNNLTPLILFISTFSLIYCPIPLVIKMKMKGDRGSPWWIPLEGEKFYEEDQFTRIEKKGVEVKDIIHLIQVDEKPKSRTICWMYCLLSLSKDLDISNLISIPTNLVVISEWTISHNIIIPSILWRPSTYVVCSRYINLGRIFLREFVKTLAMIL